MRLLSISTTILIATVCSNTQLLADDINGFQILVWQYKTDARQDVELYRRINLHGWHIDRGDGKQQSAKWAAEQKMPYYVDHAAGKGILHLTPQSGLDTIAADGTASARPWSFFDPATMAELKNRLNRNVPPVAGGPVVAIALDDEVSLGTFNSPFEVDYSDAAIAAFRASIRDRYQSDEQFQRAWNTTAPATITPATYESVRHQIDAQPPNRWRLAPWLDFRTFNDQRQSDVFAELVDHTNTLAPNIPAGIVGGQQPSAYGGFDYSLLRHSLQFAESYDIGGTNEILHSFWSDALRKPRMQTFFSSGNLPADQWFLWYYLAHGCRGVIAWPEYGGKPWFSDGQVNAHIESLAETFAAVQDDSLSVLTDPNTTSLFSPIAMLYSHPSVQVGWAIDASTHGKTWPRRLSSLDNSSLSSGKNRVAWTRLLEDLGHQPRIIDTNELLDGLLEQQQFHVLILPQTFALSRSECDAIRHFAENGGTVIADYGTAITDEHGTGYDQSPLDALFNIDRTQDRGWFNGKRYELNGELYSKPFVERLSAPPLDDSGQLKPVEASIGSTVVESAPNRGRAVFINASPTGYYDAALRSGPFGNRWRELLGEQLKKSGVAPAITFERTDSVRHGVELLRYRTTDSKEVWVFVANPTRQAAVDGAGSGLALESKPIELTIRVNGNPIPLRNLRTNETTNGRVVLPSSEAVVVQPTQ